MANEPVYITSPVGRMVMGSLYTPSTTDADGNPLLIKNGPNQGQPRVQYFMGLAIPKGPETHWALTEWGKQIWAIGHAAFPGAAQGPTFAWKVADGDSTIPDQKGRKPCEREGHAGHWIIKLANGFAPKIYKQENGGFVQLLTENEVKPGYFVQVQFSASGNGSQQRPGVYLNISMVCFRAFGQEIVFGPNVNEAGFGVAPLPAGASLTPAASPVPMPAKGAAIPPSAPAVAVPPPTDPAPSIAPNHAFLTPPVPGAIQNPTQAGIPAVPAATQLAHTIPPAPSAPAVASPSNQMTAKAGTATREQFIANGWTDAQLIAQGYMTL